MLDWYAGLATLEKAYVIVGTIGATVFAIQFILMMVGGDSQGHEVGTTDTDGVTGDHLSTDVDFQLISVQSVSAFFMMFGIVGLSLSRGGGLSSLVSLLGGLAAGASCMYFVARMFAFFRSLQSSGSVVLDNAIGKEARVYLTIRPGKDGQIEIELQGQLRIFDAISESDTAIPTNARVRVKAVNNNRFIVEAL